MKKHSNIIDRIWEKFKKGLTFIMCFILILSLLVLFRCKSRTERIKEHREKRQSAKVAAEINAIESVKNPVYTIQGKNKTLELPMQITDKGKLVSVTLGDTIFGFQLTQEDTEFTISPQGALAWHEKGILTAEKLDGEETISLRHVRIGNCELPEVNAKIVQGQEFPYLMGQKTWKALLSSLSSERPSE